MEILLGIALSTFTYGKGSMKRFLSLATLVVLFVAVTVFPVAAGLSTMTGTLTSANLLPNGKPNDCPGNVLDNNPALYSTLYYTLRQFTVTATGNYHFKDVGILDSDPGTIDIEVNFYTGTPGGFDPADPTGDGCFRTSDDGDFLPLDAGVTYMMMITSNSDSPNTGNYIFSLDGPGDVQEVVSASSGCINPLPDSSVVRSIPNGAMAFFGPNLQDGANFNLPAGTWWTTQTSGDFTQVWISCQANLIWVPSSAVSP
jgi:hypothetical protein